MVSVNDVANQFAVSAFNLAGVLAHHAARTPDQAMHGLRGRETTTYGEMARRAARVGRRDCASLASVGATSWRPPLVQLPRVPRDDLRRQPPRRDRACRSTGGSRRRRCATSSSTPRPGRSCATRPSSSLANDATKGIEARWCGPASRRGARRVDGPRRPPGDPGAVARVRGGGRRRPPADVHVGHHRTAQGRHDHPRQPGVEEPRPHRRVRLHQRRSRARLRAALPRRRARPHDHHAHRGGRDDDHPSRRSTPPRSSTSSSDRGSPPCGWRPAMVNAIMALPDIEQRDLRRCG